MCMNLHATLQLQMPLKTLWDRLLSVNMALCLDVTFSVCLCKYVGLQSVGLNADEFEVTKKKLTYPR